MKPIVIVGGTYREICRFPEHRNVFGSGGRAAAALSILNPDVTLHTFVTEEFHALGVPVLGSEANWACFRSESNRVDSIITFNINLLVGHCLFAPLHKA